MDPGVFLRGLVIGFAIAAPVGPIGVLCIRRTLADGRLAGLLSGLGAATADAVYGFVAAFGLTLVSGLLISQQDWIRLLGGLYLCYLGLRSWTAPVAEEPATASGRGLLGAYASTFFLTLTNPVTILSFVAIFAGLGLAGQAEDGYAAAGLLVVGVFSGSALWWLSLSTAVSVFRRLLTPQRLRWVNRLSGALILGFGAVALAGLL